MFGRENDSKLSSFAPALDSWIVFFYFYLKLLPLACGKPLNMFFWFQIIIIVIIIINLSTWHCAAQYCTIKQITTPQQWLAVWNIITIPQCMLWASVNDLPKVIWIKFLNILFPGGHRKTFRGTSFCLMKNLIKHMLYMPVNKHTRLLLTEDEELWAYIFLIRFLLLINKEEEEVKEGGLMRKLIQTACVRAQYCIT